MQVWDIKRGHVLDCVNPSPRLLHCFDPEKSFYLYEPGRSREEPPYEELLIPIMCSVSPDDVRYKEFQKNDAVKVYMPTWTLNELQAVGEFLYKRNPVQMPLEPADIAKRFLAVGGIFRHVFASKFSTVLAAQRVAISVLDPKKFKLNKIESELEDVSHHVAQYRVVTEGPKAFEEANVDLVSDGVREAVEARFLKLDLNEKIFTLMKNDECPGYMSSLCPLYYEDVIAGQLLEGVDWLKKNLTDSNFSGFGLQLTKLEEGKPPTFAEMEPEVLYKSLKRNFPAVDMMYKTKEGVLFGLQVTRDSSKTIGTKAVIKWLEAIDMKNNTEKVRIAVIPNPDLAEKFKVAYDDDDYGYPQLELWKLPRKYDRSF